MIEINTQSQLPRMVKRLVLLKLFIAFSLISFLGFMSGNNDVGAFFFFLWILFGLPVYIFKALVYKNTSFLVTENTISINTGILIKKSVTIPFNRIQNINCEQGILERLLNLKRLNIWTASASQMNADVTKNYSSAGHLVLLKEDAEALQKIMISENKVVSLLGDIAQNTNQIAQNTNK